MSGLRSELLKLRTTRTFAALTAIAVLVSLVPTVLLGVLSEPSREDVLFEVFANDFSSLFIVVLAVIGITGEWRHRTIASSLLAAPDRLRFLAAKVVAFALAGLLLSLATSIAITIVGATLLSIRDLPLPGFGELVALIGRNALVGLLLGGLGVSFGALVRNQAAALVAVLALTFAIEPALMGFVPAIARYGPFGWLPLAVLDLPADTLGEDVDLPAPGVAVLALLGWIGATYAAGGALLLRRDLD